MYMDKKTKASETSPASVAPSPKQLAESATANKHLSPTATILLVDSDPVMRAVFRDALQSPGFWILEAGDLGAAVDRLDDVHPDLLIIRPYISGMPGRTAANYLQTRQHGLPVLIVGGFVEDERLINQSAVEDFFTFPQAFSRSALLAKVKDVLAEVKGHRETRTA
jgi:DNA-binding response OmpR family regulator